LVGSVEIEEVVLGAAEGTELGVDDVVLEVSDVDAAELLDELELAAAEVVEAAVGGSTSVMLKSRASKTSAPVTAAVRHKKAIDSVVDRILFG